MAEEIVLEVNGRQHRVRVEPDTPLLYILRNDLGLTGAKLGCALERCGACKVIVGGEAVFVDVQADGELPHQGAVAGTDDRGRLGVYESFGRSGDGVEEILAVVADVEAEKIVPQQALDQLAPPWADPKRLAVRPRDMPELADENRRIGLTKERGQ